MTAILVVYLSGGCSVAQDALSREVLDCIEELHSPKVHIRESAAMALGCKDPAGRPARPVALPALHEALNDPEPGVRSYAARAIGMLDPDDKTALPVLLAVLRHPKAKVRSQAAVDLTDLAPQATGAIPVLIDLLRDESADVRGRAVYCLSLFGPAAAKSVDAIVPLLRNPDDEVRKDGALALGEIGRGQGGAAGPARGGEGPRQLRPTVGDGGVGGRGTPRIPKRCRCWPTPWGRTTMTFILWPQRR